MLKGVNGADRMIAVVHADAHRIHRDGVDHLLVIFKGGRFHFEFLEERFRLAGDQVARGDDLNVGLMLIRFHMAVRDSAGADNADAQLPVAANRLLFRHVAREVVHVKCHCRFLPYV